LVKECRWGFGSKEILRRAPTLCRIVASGHCARGEELAGREVAVSFYENWIFPPILDLAMQQKQLVGYRKRVVGEARGKVLEIGAGSGLNFPFYGDQVERVLALDPSPRLLGFARRRAAAGKVPIEFLLGSATSIPLPDHSIDTVVMTWTLCSIPDASAALAEMRRVLKGNGRLLFVEHGLAPDLAVEKWQHRLTPAWRHIAGGCHLNRKMDEVIELAGFDLKKLQTGYAPGPRPMTFMYEGCACQSRR
jgi:SAM-dependent methyltransferase